MVVHRYQQDATHHTAKQEVVRKGAMCHNRQIGSDSSLMFSENKCADNSMRGAAYNDEDSQTHRQC